MIFVRYDCPFLDGNPNCLLVFTVHECVDVFAIILEDQVSFAKRTASQHLDGIHAAGAVLDDCDHLLVLSRLPQFSQRNQRDP